MGTSLKWIVGSVFIIFCWLLFLALNKQRKTSKEDQLSIIADVDRTIIQQFHFGDVNVRLPLRNSSIVTMSNRLGTISKEFNNSLIQETVLGDERRGLRVRLHLQNDRILKAEIRSTADYKQAAELWARLVKERIPTIKVTLENTEP